MLDMYFKMFTEREMAHYENEVEQDPVGPIQLP